MGGSGKNTDEEKMRCGWQLRIWRASKNEEKVVFFANAIWDLLCAINAVHYEWWWLGVMNAVFVCQEVIVSLFIYTTVLCTFYYIYAFPIKQKLEEKNVWSWPFWEQIYGCMERAQRGNYPSLIECLLIPVRLKDISPISLRRSIPCPYHQILYVYEIAVPNWLQSPWINTKSICVPAPGVWLSVLACWGEV